MGLDGLGPKMNGPDDLGKRLRRKKRARVASPQPDSRSQSNSYGPQSSVTVCCCAVYYAMIEQCYTVAMYLRAKVLHACAQYQVLTA